MLGFFAGLTAFIKAVPVIKELVDRFITFYIEREIASMKKENAEAVTIAVLKHDQRPIEHALGSPNAGKPSGIPGVQIRDRIPGVDE
jgi:hypothetical protein